jgi:lysophospholipid acyltransferase (LPLAT)-like uncharacterized protein
LKITPRRARWIGRLGVAFLHCLGATWRVRRIGLPMPEDHGALLFAFLHGNILPTAYIHRSTKAAVMISEHGDGEVIAQIASRLGYVPVRGSSTRGGARAFLRLARDHADRIVAITPDGPRGPRGSVHEGVIQLAAETGRKILPASYAVLRGKRLGSWDRFVIPGPFARIVEHLGEPLAVPKGLDGLHRAELARELERRFVEGEAKVEQSLRDGAW